jgi:hypothetical protein
MLCAFACGTLAAMPKLRWLVRKRIGNLAAGVRVPKHRVAIQEDRGCVRQRALLRNSRLRHLDFGGLAVGVSCGDAVPEGLEAAHLRLDPASGMVSRPALPECPAVVPGGAQGFVSGDRGWTVLFPRSAVQSGLGMQSACGDAGRRKSSRHNCYRLTTLTVRTSVSAVPYLLRNRK